MEQSKTENLAERIALLLQDEMRNGGTAELRRALEQIGNRLSVIEENLSINNNPTPVVAAGGSQSLHPSQERFLNLEQLADQVLDSISQKEKACPFEPAGKPCDNCAMCNSRGF